MAAAAFTAAFAWGAAATHPCAKGKAVTPEPPLVLAGIVRGDGTSIELDAADIAPGTVFHAVGKRDRYGRVPTVALRAGTSRQERLLRSGRAVALPVRLPAACRAALLAAEARARDDRRGLWRRGLWRRGPERAADPRLRERTDRFAVVEGRVVSVGDRERALYLNFGANWSDDTTVFVSRKDFRRHPEWLRILAAAAGRTVRVRGWLEERGGPYMRVRDVGQIELLPDRGSRKRANGAPADDGPAGG